jgi:lysyl-tRNA synthetase class 1
MYGKPKAAKRLYFDVIPRAVDDYLGQLRGFVAQDPAARLDNPVWHIHDGAPPREDTSLGFGVLLNLASVCHAEDKAVLWGFITGYDARATPESHPILDRLVGHAIAYYRDFVKPSKRYRAASEAERVALADLAAELAAMPADADAESFQNRVYEVGKRHPFGNLRDWFRALYEVLLGQSQGPRFGSFIALYGRDETVALIHRALAGEDLSAV